MWKDQLYCEALTVSALSLWRLRSVFIETILWSEDTSLKEECASQFTVLFFPFLFMNI